ncbi:50S ribosomal protein L23 [Maricaulis sp.]|uniref:50S ribosomal protein L23 n=1 Tax=unclassified Maricaulis TaxID=2632371 RepID=UPI001B16B8AC|nr:50S ribosomal protein L23 [Maricaulis sp.]MBO6798183.1 50S ribosomal protein L23 [Maricaulis sp.]
MSVAARHYDVILAPVFTEKSTLLEEGKNAFYVPVTATKTQIKEAVEAIYAKEKKTVVAVNTIKIHGKVKRFRGMLGKRNDQKKAIVTFADGKSLDLTGDF